MYNFCLDKIYNVQINSWINCAKNILYVNQCDVLCFLHIIMDLVYDINQSVSNYAFIIQLVCYAEV